MVKKISDTEQLIDFIVDVLIEKKAHDVVILNISQKSSITDYFVIANGEVAKHVKALADELEDQMRTKMKRKLLRSDGLIEKEWIVLDYGEIIVHLFIPSQRQLFRLEDLWHPKKIKVV